jgi:hypothetical protein
LGDGIKDGHGGFHALVWFMIKLVKRIKAFFWTRSIEKRLAKEIIPSAYRSVEQIGEYIGSI